MVARGFTLRAQVQRARRQEAYELARARVTALEKIAVAERERIANERNRAAVMKAQQVRQEAAELAARVGTFLADMIHGFEEIEAAAKELNTRSGGVTLGRFRPPTDYGAVWPMLEAQLHRLAGLYPAPADRSTYSTKGEGNA